jgi:hypothetical protein
MQSQVVERDQEWVDYFSACSGLDVRSIVLRMLTFRRLPAIADADVRAALQQVHPSSQTLLIQAAVDARLSTRVALERLGCLWVFAASVNLADDLADGDCNYLEPRAAPGVSFLLQALASMLAARSELSERCREEYAEALVLAASGQCLEVRAQRLSASEYLKIAGLIAGHQYNAYLRLLWDGSWLESRAAGLGLALGTVGLVVTDMASGDPRFTAMDPGERAQVLSRCQELLAELDASHLPSLAAFAQLAREAGAFRGAEVSRDPAAAPDVVVNKGDLVLLD